MVSAALDTIPEIKTTRIDYLTKLEKIEAGGLIPHADISGFLDSLIMHRVSLFVYYIYDNSCVNLLDRGVL